MSENELTADEQEWFWFFRRKYVARADERQRQMGLLYTEAETHDLAKACAGFAAQRLAGREEAGPVQSAEPVKGIVVADQKMARYFGAWAPSQLGHHLFAPNGRYDLRVNLPGFPWDTPLMDTGLLKNGEHPDVYDGKVFWTCGGTPLWLAFFWWDRSGDRRENSNSGFYVTGFDHLHAMEAFQFACAEFPSIVARQRVQLELVVSKTRVAT